MFIKIRNLVVIFITLIIITIISSLVVIFTKEKEQSLVSKKSVEAVKQVKLAADKPAVTTPDVPEKIATPQTTPSGLLGTGLVSGEKKVEASPTAEVPVEEKIKAVMIIDGFKYEAAVKPGNSAYDLMILLKSQNKIDFSGKNYSGLGFFVEVINRFSSFNSN